MYHDAISVKRVDSPSAWLLIWDVKVNKTEIHSIQRFIAFSDTSWALTSNISDEGEEKLRQTFSISQFIFALYVSILLLRVVMPLELMWVNNVWFKWNWNVEASFVNVFSTNTQLRTIEVRWAFNFPIVDWVSTLFNNWWLSCMVIIERVRYDAISCVTTENICRFFKLFWLIVSNFKK